MSETPISVAVRQWKGLLICLGVELAVTDTSYMVSGYVPTYLKKTAGVGDTAALVMVLVVLAVLTVGGLSIRVMVRLKSA